ncbi:hypothetical protein FCJ61_06880 [Burkholderia metallica]|nr:hypothetical protein [Burkholderia metallica]
MSRDGRIRITVRRHCSANHRPPDWRFGCDSRDQNVLDGAGAPPLASYNAVPSTVSDRPPCQPPSPSSR